MKVQENHKNRRKSRKYKKIMKIEGQYPNRFIKYFSDSCGNHALLCYITAKHLRLWKHSLLFMSFSFFSSFSLLSLILCLSLSRFIQGELSAAVAEQRVVLRTMDQLFGSDVRLIILFSTTQFYFFILYYSMLL